MISSYLSTFVCALAEKIWHFTPSRFPLIKRFDTWRNANFSRSSRRDLKLVCCFSPDNIPESTQINKQKTAVIYFCFWIHLLMHLMRFFNSFLCSCRWDLTICHYFLSPALLRKAVSSIHSAWTPSRYQFWPLDFGLLLVSVCAQQKDQL